MADMEHDTDLHQIKREKKKKKKKSNNKLTVKIETIKPHPEKSAPLVGYFPSGFNPHATNPDSEPHSVHLFRHQAKPKRCQLVVSPSESSNVNFVGDSHSGEAAAGQMCTYALGVLDKETQKLKIVPITAERVFRLEPRVASDGWGKEPSTPAKVENTRAEKLRDLTISYGTKKAIKQAEKIMRLTEDPGAEEDLAAKLQENPIDKDALASTSAAITRNTPPCDLSATEPEKAYPLEKIILVGEWDHLLDIFKLLQTGEDIRMDYYPSFVCNRAYKLELLQDETEKRRLCSILSYINHLLKFKDRHSMDGHSKAKHHKLPSILRQKFSNMFVETDRIELSVEKLSLLISHVLVLTLFVDKFESDPEDIARDLRMTVGSLRVHYENLGCKLKRVNNKTIATLPVPLKFQEVRRKRRR